jgi:hypothetical protein
MIIFHFIFSEVIDSNKCLIMNYNNNSQICQIVQVDEQNIERSKETKIKIDIEWADIL